MLERQETVCESPSRSAITNGHSPSSPPFTWREGVSLTRESIGAGQVPDSFIRERDIVPLKQRLLWGLLSTVFALLFSFCLGLDLAVYGIVTSCSSSCSSVNRTQNLSTRTCIPAFCTASRTHPCFCLLSESFIQRETCCLLLFS